MDLGPRVPPVLYNLACAYALSGRKDEALARLKDAVATGWGNRDQIENDAALASLKSDPRFAEILANTRPR